MTIVFVGHVEKQEMGSSVDAVQLTINGEVAVCREKLVVMCNKADASMYTPGTVVRVQIHPA